MTYGAGVSALLFCVYGYGLAAYKWPPCADTAGEGTDSAVAACIGRQLCDQDCIKLSGKRWLFDFDQRNKSVARVDECGVSF